MRTMSTCLLLQMAGKGFSPRSGRRDGDFRDGHAEGDADRISPLLRHSKAPLGTTALCGSGPPSSTISTSLYLSESLRHIEICLVATSIRRPLKACSITSSYGLARGGVRDALALEMKSERERAGLTMLPNSNENCILREAGM